MSEQPNPVDRKNREFVEVLTEGLRGALQDIFDNKENMTKIAESLKGFFSIYFDSNEHLGYSVTPISRDKSNQDQASTAISLTEIEKALRYLNTVLKNQPNDSFILGIVEDMDNFVELSITNNDGEIVVKVVNLQIDKQG